MRASRIAAIFLLTVLGIAPAAAQAPYPTRPIHIVVPFPAGGPSDVLSRMLGERMAKDFGQAIVVDNRPGANTVIGAELVAKAAPDGYTLLMAIDSTLVMNQYLYSHLPYDPIKDFVPVSLAAKNMGWLVVNASSPYKTANDLVAKAKAAPGKLNCGAGTITTKLTCVLFNDKFGLNTVLISYNGSANVAQGVLTGGADFVFDGTAAELSLVQAGNLRALAKLDSRAVCAAAEAAVAVAGDRRRPRRSRGLERSGGAARYPAGRDRQALGRSAEGPQRAGSQGQGRNRRHLCGQFHTRRVRRLHQARGRALAGRSEEKRHAF